MRAWVTRHINRMLSLHTQRPCKVGGIYFKDWRSSSRTYINEEDLPEGVNPHYEDEEPIEVALKLEKV